MAYEDFLRDLMQRLSAHDGSASITSGAMPVVAPNDLVGQRMAYLNQIMRGMAQGQAARQTVPLQGLFGGNPAPPPLTIQYTTSPQFQPSGDGRRRGGTEGHQLGWQWDGKR